MKLASSAIIYFACFATLWSLSQARKAKKWDEIKGAISSLISLVNNMNAKMEDLIEANAGCTDAVNRCQDGWLEFHNSCFHFVATKMSWQNAMKNCQSLVEGGHLAEVDSAEKDRFLTEQLKWFGNTKGAWVGASDDREEGQWRWVIADKIAPYLKWCQIEPNGATGENCLQYNYMGGDCWVDNSCSALVPSICEVAKLK